MASSVDSFGIQYSSPHCSVVSHRISLPVLQQIDSYVNWINNQLARRPNSRRVTDLSNDLKDGVVFLQLVEAITAEKQKLIDGPLLSISNMKTNFSTVLHFLSKRKIRIHHIMPEEIMEGNLKATMRLVLALAAHFKPQSFKCDGFQNTAGYQNHKKAPQRTSLSSLASDAAASLVEASKNASKTDTPSQLTRRNNSLDSPTPSKSRFSIYSSDTLLNQRKSFRMDNSDIPDIHHKVDFTKKKRSESDLKVLDGENGSFLHRGIKTPQARHNFEAKNTVNYRLVSTPIYTTIDTDYQIEITERHKCMLEDLSSAKNALVQLQDLLLSYCSPREELDMQSPNVELCQEQLVIKNILLERKMYECDDMKSEVHELQEINSVLSGEKTALEERVSQQDQSILSLTSQLLQRETAEKTTTSRKQLDASLLARDKEIELLHDEIKKRDNFINEQQKKIDSLSSDIVSNNRKETNLYSKLESSESLVRNLRFQVQKLTEQGPNASMRLQKDGTKSATHKMNETKFLKEKQKILREHSNMKVTLINIKARFKPDDPVQHAFQSMEQSMTSLNDILNVIESNFQAKENSSMHSYPLSIHSPVSSCSGFDYNGNVSVDGRRNEQVKIVYFLGKSTTPEQQRTDICIGHLTLRDFKQIIKLSGSYRYYFKAVDEDFGFVREELLADNDVIPGYEGKVVAWLEKQVQEI